MRDSGGRRSDYTEGATPSVTCAVHEDKEGALWIATTAGLRRVHNGRSNTLTQTNGLPTNSLTTLVEDRDGFLWIGFKSEVIRLAKGEVDKAAQDSSYRVRYTHYDASDGVPVPLRCRRSVARQVDGTLWFVTDAGVAVIDPGRLPTSAPPPTVFIERVAADDQSLSHPPEGMAFPRGTASLRIDYGAPSLASATKLRFQFRLEGLDRSWVDAGAARQAVYTDLQPGAYRFHVRSTAGGNNEAVTQWAFTVQPFFYQTKGFYTACILACCVTLAAVWKLWVGHLHRQFTVILDERTRIARELHDTLLQSMAGMVLKVEALAMDATGTVAHGLRDLRREMEYHIEEARESIWNLRSSVLEKQTLAGALQEFAHVVEGYPGHVEVTVVGKPQRYSREVEEQLLRIGQEAMRNAVRHANAKHLCVELAYERDRVKLRVVDDGCGFDVASQREGAGLGPQWGLRGIRERAARVGGRVQVLSGAGGGTEVEVTVPAHI
jgi:signal transduction histidine kinase